MQQIDKDVYIVGQSVVAFNKKGQGHSSVKIKQPEGSDKFCEWGDDNLYPQNFFKKLANTDAASGGLEVLVSAHFGKGFKLYQPVEEGNEVVLKERLPLSFPEINEFFKRTRFQIFMSDVISDYETYNIAYVEYLLSPNKEKIISVKRHQSAFCRLGVPSKSSGRIEKVFINSDWEDYDEKFTQKVDFFSPDIYWEEIKQYCKQKDIDRFVIPVVGTLTSEKLYPIVNWHSSFRNGWVDVVNSVPELKKHLFENQLHVKYVVYVADDFFSHKYGQTEWNDFSTEKKEKLREELVKKIDDHMSGNKAGGRSLISPYFRDASGNLIKGIEVEAIDNKIKDGNFLPDAASGNAEILFSMGVDPCLLGAGIPGAKNLSGSGSDKREAYTILCTRMPIKRERTLEIFNRVRDWNGWDDTLVGNFPNIVLTTLDKEKSGQKEVVN